MAFLGIAIPAEIGNLLTQIPVPEKRESKDTYHITLCHLGDELTIEAITAATTAAFNLASQTKPFAISTKLVTSFPTNPSGTPVICKVESAELHAFHDKLKAAFDTAGVEYSKKWPEFKPHITLAYAQDGAPEDQEIPPVSFTVSEFVLWGGDKGDDAIEVRFPLQMSVTAALKVAARFQREVLAKKTENYAKFEGALKPIEEPLSAVSAAIAYSYFRKKPEPERLEQLAKELSNSSREALTQLKVEFENPKLGERAKKFMARFKNFLKMIIQWSTANTWAELEPVLMKQNTKAKTPYQKYMEYRDEMLGLIGHLDTEQEGHLDVAGWGVTLWTAPNSDWDSDMTDMVQYVLRESSKVLSGMGMGAVAGGQVFAYPSKTLPGASGAHSALAAYQRSTDMMWIAAGGDSARVLQSLVHESGHRAFWQVVSPNGRERWNAFFDEQSGPPDVDSLIREWEAYTQKDDHWAQKYGRFFNEFYSYLKDKDATAATWLEIIERKMDFRKDEKRNNSTGGKSKDSQPALDSLIAHRSEVKVFLHPVTAYSATSPGELFAEVFAHYAINGAGRIPEIVRDMFHKVLPQFRVGSVT